MDVPTKFGWGISQAEHYDPTHNLIHSQIPKNSPLLKWSKVDKESYLEDRWRWLVVPVRADSLR